MLLNPTEATQPPQALLPHSSCPAVLVDPEAVLPLDSGGGIGFELFVVELNTDVAIAVSERCGKGAFKAVAFEENRLCARRRKIKGTNVG